MLKRIAVVALVLVALATACGDANGGSGDEVEGSITVYSGRKEELVGALITMFEESTGVDVSVRYASGPELAATLREEGSNSPADVFFAEDPASLGAVAIEGLFVELPADILALVPARFADVDGRWVGTSGRARTLAYDTTALGMGDLPTGVDGLTDPAWKGRIGIAPGNGSFQAFVAAMILADGEEATREWLEALAANDPKTYPKNSTIVAAVDDGEIEVGLVNHYYALLRADEVGATDVANHFFANGGAEALVMPAGAGVLASTDNRAAALAFVAFLLSDEAQRFFVDETHEYPLITGIDPDPVLPPLDSLNPPDLDLSDLATSIDRAADLIADAGLL